MPLSKSKGQMYPWVDFCHSHIAGECPHACSYCFVQKMGDRFPLVKKRYSGPVRLIEKEFEVNYGSGKTIFIEHMNDMFALEDVPNKWIVSILEHCHKFPANDYVFQTKNPGRAWMWNMNFPDNSIIGTTIESNRIYETISKAPPPIDRFAGLLKFAGAGNMQIFVTIEPVLDFDVDVLLGWFSALRPSFVNIGADSKHCKLPEPSDDKIMALVDGLQAMHIVIKKKTNLERIFK